MSKLIRVIGVLGLSLALAGPAWATNGMNMISFGGQEAGMAGASLGVSDNPVAMNNNPAGLSQIKGQELTVGISALMPNLKHEDRFSNSVDGESNIFLLPMAAYAYHHQGSPWTLGLGLFGQGGMGADFQNLNTAFGTKDQTFTNVSYAKVTPSLAYQVNDKLSLGAALNIGYAAMEMKYFPNTVVPGVFYGMNLQNVYGFGYGVKVGAQYKATEMVTLGLVYTSKSSLDFKHGDMTFAGAGKYSAEVEGFNWPQSVGAGVAVRPTKKLLLAADLTWVNWKNAMDQVDIKTNAPGPLSNIHFNMNWKDQIVLALGAAYKLTDVWTVRAGYNYGNNPVPAETLSSLFPAIPEHHLTLGLGYKINDSWCLDAGWEHAFSNSVTYTNPDTPFGPNAVETHDQNTVSIFATVKF
ncbi:MAG: outer membrane protein transport protein [Pseudomonadota bacterium]